MIFAVMHNNGIPLQFLRPPKPSIANFPTRNPISLSYGPSTYGGTGRQDNFKYDKEISSSENTLSHNHSVISPNIPGLTVGQAGIFNQFPNPALAEHSIEEKIIDASLATQIPGNCPPLPPPSPTVRLTGKALSSAIEKEYSPKRLLHLVATYKEALTPVQICTAFHRIGKRSSKLGESRKASLRNDESVIWLAARVDDCLPLYEAQALTNVAW